MNQRTIEAAIPDGFRVLQDRQLGRKIGRRLLSPALVAHLMRAGDLVAIFVSALMAAFVRHGGLAFASIETLLLLGVALFASNAFSLAGSYDEAELRRPGRQIRYVLSLWTMSVTLGLVGLFLLKVSDDVSRLWILAWYLSAAVLLVLIRLSVARAVTVLRTAGFMLRRVLVIGHGAHGQAMLDALRTQDQDIEVMGYLESGGEHLPLEQTSWLNRFLRDRRIEHVVLALPWSDTDRAALLVAKLRRHPVSVSFLPGSEDGSASLPLRGIATFAGRPALRLVDRPLDERTYLMKSLQDRLLGAALLVGIAPLLLAIGILVKLTSKGPVFFRQARIGFHGEEFSVYKFRTMHIHLCDQDPRRFAPHTARDDPRITALGAFLRKTSLDELPQLINVVLGDMSLVGPRPHAVAHDDHYGALIDEYLSRHRVKPGITGWAQVNGARGEIADLKQMEQRIRYDLDYIERCSLGFDLWIMLRTAGLVAGDRHAF